MDNYKLLTFHHGTFLHHKYSYSITQYGYWDNYRYDLEIKIDNKVVKRINGCKEEKWLRTYVKGFIDSLLIKLNNDNI